MLSSLRGMTVERLGNFVLNGGLRGGVEFVSSRHQPKTKSESLIMSDTLTAPAPSRVNQVTITNDALNVSARYLRKYFGKRGEHVVQENLKCVREGLRA